MGTVVLAFYKQENLLYIKGQLTENLSYTFQSLLKNITLLPADSSADSFVKNT